MLESPIKGAIAKGIPVITVNSGTAEQSKKLGALMHIGQPEYDAGKGAGERAKAAGVTKFLCVNHYITNTASVERCQGYADGLGVKLGDQMLDSGIDPTEVYNKVKAYLTAHPDTDGILTLGPNAADPTIKLLRDTGTASKVQELHHLRSRRRHLQGDQGRRHERRDRPAALPAGLSAGGVPDRIRPLRRDPGQQRQHRPGLRDQEEHRARREACRANTAKLLTGWLAMPAARSILRENRVDRPISRSGGRERPSGRSRTSDERLKVGNRVAQRFSRGPNLGALAGVVLVFVFFAVTAGGTGMFAADGVLNWATVSRPAHDHRGRRRLLMIGGEFDLSVGSMIGFAGMMIALPTIYFGVPIGSSASCAFVAALAIGCLNGLIIVRTGLPSFIVTLASLYILRGLTIALSILCTNRTIVSGVKEGRRQFVARFSRHAFRLSFTGWPTTASSTSCRMASRASRASRC